MKWRNSKERELLSAGGSRDVTLPGKDNPHPDLSDTLPLRHHDTDGFPSAGGGGFPVVSATDLRMRNVEYGGPCDDVIVYDVIDKRRCANECPDRDDTIHVI